MIFAGVGIVIRPLIVHRILYTFLIDLIDKVLAVLAPSALHPRIAATFIEVLFLSERRGGGIRLKINITGHVLIECHAFGEAALGLGT